MMKRERNARREPRCSVIIELEILLKEKREGEKRRTESKGTEEKKMIICSDTDTERWNRPREHNQQSVGRL